MSSIEFRNIVGNYAEIYEKENDVLLMTWTFASPPTNSTEQVFKAVSTQKLIKLKEAGFDADEIIKMCKEFIID